MERYTPQNLWATFVNFSAQNAGFTLSVAYVLLTLCGIFYADAFYEQFGIPFLKLAETSDLLIVGISEPMALLMLGIAVQIALLYDYLTRKSFHWQQHWRKKPPSIKRRVLLMTLYVPKYQETAVSGLIVMFVLYVYVFVTLFAEWHSNRITADDSKRITVYLDGNQANENMLLLGSTANYLFAYDIDEQKSRIYPVQNIIRIEPAVTPKEEETQPSVPPSSLQTDKTIGTPENNRDSRGHQRDQAVQEGKIGPADA